ncbi:NADH:ubiquinone oxidoreductase subunit 1 (chain H) [Novosphingobium sp. PC22D]|uniref:NADH-quinone oxidoreductase subunit H n=1 Tax=Novosphingobium sp. PC22D TaxID=1962403 RepID=UPI000BEF8A87|nr:NADH-quinone oxidoreductase subunit H [Novosphingobium sp. PC22D]PEQ11537.1 NADH:ubiquinone oxidoreductase subunit 1 (chain H) [Novosphingobium sp. PC22D]
MTAIPLVFALLAAGIWLSALAERFASGRRFPSGTVFAPLLQAARLLSQQSVRTEHPDGLNWVLSPIAYLTLAVAGLSVVPFAPELAVAPLDTGIVLWGACEALTIVAVFLHGWSANSMLPLIGGYRFVAIGLPAMLLSMFVLIAAALPAQSLSVGAIVESQRSLWNVVRQPLGLPLFLLLGLAISLRGPMDYGDAADLSGGTAAEVSGPHRLAWGIARLAMLTAFAAMGASVFLGGYLGPWLPGPVWLALKTAALLLVLTWLGRNLARMPAPRMMAALWLVLLPLSFLDLVIAGVEALP